MKRKLLLYRAHRCLWSACTTFLLMTILAILPCRGFAFQFGEGDLAGSLDTTISYGLQSRLEDPDMAIVGLRNDGKAYSVNGDDGNLNHRDTGLISSAIKLTTDLEISYGNLGLFVRGSAFHDFELSDKERQHINMTDDALELVGEDVQLLDAYVFASFDIADTTWEFRLGEQLVSWGESTFIQNSINTINPVDVSALRVPGSELREALLPEGMAYLSVSLTENLSVEGLYLYDWENTEIDPPGSYFSTSDFAGVSGSRVMLGFGEFSEFGTPGLGDNFMAVSRAYLEEPDDSGQFGIALRWFAPFLGDTEFGFYGISYHSRLPVISGRSGTAGGLGNAVAAYATIGAYTTPGSPTAGDPVGSIATGVAAGTAFGATNAVRSAQGVLTVAGTAPTAVPVYITDLYAQTARYIVEYPEEIDLLGVSFNTDLGATGIALQGEVSHRLDAPLQVDDVELLFAALTPLSSPLPPPLPPITTAPLENQLEPGGVGLETYIPGYILRDVTQVQATATKVFGQILGADTVALVGEFAVTIVHDMPEKETLRLEGPGTFTSGNAFHATGGLHAGKAAEPLDKFPDAESWGYRLAGKLEYNNAIGPIGLVPRFSWQHDVKGISPGPGGNFIEGRKAVTVGVTANYLNSWSIDLSYTSYFGADRYNLISDRDFIAANIKYAF